MMKRFLSSAALLALASLGVRARAEDPPHVVLKNDTVTLTVLLPDTTKGYYRGSRFDWHGIVSKVEYAGHTLFNEWKTPHDPNGHDDVGGTAEEFGMFTPIGYDAAAPGTGVPEDRDRDFATARQGEICILEAVQGCEHRPRDGNVNPAHGRVPPGN